VPASETTAVDWVWARRDHGGSIALLDDRERGASRGVDELVADADDVARGLAGRGIGRGDRAVVVMTWTFDAIVAALAVLRAGATLVPLPAPGRVDSASRMRARVDGATARTGAALVIGEWGGVTVDDLRGSGGRTPAMPSPDDVALITFTSGTTATARAVVKSHAGLGAAVRIADDDERQIRRRVSWLALHNRGLCTEILRPMGEGAHIDLLPAPAFAARPLRWLTAISRSRAEFSGGPASAYRVVAGQLERSGGVEALDLSCWRIARCSSEAIDADVLQRFSVAAEPYGFRPDALMAAYGLSEASQVARRPAGRGLRIDVVDRDGLGELAAAPVPADHARAVRVVSVGSPVTDVRLKVVDQSGAEVADRCVGEIVVQSPTTMVGYLDEPAATDEVLRDGWVHTGDLGYVVDGELFVTGRIKDTIVIRGKSYFAPDIERCLDGIDGIDPEAAAAIGVRRDSTDSLVLVVEVETDDGSHRRAVTRLLHERVGVAPSDVVVVARGSLPRTANGKLQRAIVREEYEAARA
jgi:fatty-acyl-CoA synthase